MSLGSRELSEEFHQKQNQLMIELNVELLPRHKDRILHLTWSGTPLVYNHPRFGALEIQLVDRPRGGWQVTLTQALQDTDDHILKWVLWREALLSLLLPHLRHIPEAADLGLYAGLSYGSFTNSEKEALSALWKQVSPPQHYQKYIYDAPFGFPLFEQVVSGTFLHRAISWLNTLRPTTTRTPLATTTYTAALERWMLETHIPLTQPEHHILIALSHLTTSLHQSRLAEQLNMSNASLSQHLTTLAQRHLLRLNHFINLPLIGLTPLELVIHAPNHEIRQELTRILSKIRYTWFINTLKHTGLHCRVFIPTNKINEFQEWLTAVSTKFELLPINPFRTADILQSWNLDIYIPYQGWPYDFTYQLHQIQTILNDDCEAPSVYLSKSSISYELLQKSKKYPIALRLEDFTYFLRAADIHQITDRITAQASKELQKAGISKTAHMVYRRRIRKLEKMNISYVKGMFLTHIGLDTVLQIYINESRTIIEHVTKSLSVLPSVNGLIFDNDYGLIFLNIPNHSAVETLSTIRKLFSKHEINAIIEAKPSWLSLSGFEYPVKSKNYDFEKREWKWEQTTLPEIDLR